MKVLLVPSAHSAAVGTQYLTSFLVNDIVAIDAGAIGFYRDPRDQAAIGHVFLSHSHIDHFASLPIFLENVAGLAAEPVTVYAGEAVRRTLTDDVFNDRLWPNFLKLTQDGKPFLRLCPLEHGQAVAAGGLRVTPVALDHVVPTFGFILEDAKSAVAIVSDTGPTEEIWRRAAATPNLKAVFLEATFPDDMSDLASLTGHLTPEGLHSELRKLPGTPRLFAIHLKAKYIDRLRARLQSLSVPLEVAAPGVVYEF